MTKDILPVESTRVQNDGEGFLWLILIVWSAIWIGYMVKIIVEALI